MIMARSPQRVDVVKVLIGQVHLTRPPHVLETVLGSCIGLVVYDAQSRLAGMAHILLPDSNHRPAANLPGKYADHALACLIEGLLHHGARRSCLEAKYAGGARMFAAQGTPQQDIGASNIAAVAALLRRQAIVTRARDVGGSIGRRARFIPATLELGVEDFAQRNHTV